MHVSVIIPCNMLSRSIQKSFPTYSKPFMNIILPFLPFKFPWISRRIQEYENLQERLKSKETRKQIQINWGSRACLKKGIKKNQTLKIILCKWFFYGKRSKISFFAVFGLHHHHLCAITLSKSFRKAFEYHCANNNVFFSQRLAKWMEKLKIQQIRKVWELECFCACSFR